MNMTGILQMDEIISSICINNKLWSIFIRYTSYFSKLYYLIFLTTLLDIHFHYFHFTDEEIMSQESQITCPW